MDARNIQIVIPCYEPDDAFLTLIGYIRGHGSKIKCNEVIVVNDGSDNSYEHYFIDAAKKYGCTILRHAVNLGKGRAMKTAFNHIINCYPDSIGCVTVDSDGQHKLDDIEKVVTALSTNPEKMILGCRNFDADYIPWKSKFGNMLTKVVFSFLCGINISDTQTGLRGLSCSYMRELMNIPGERFEFETNTLIKCKNNIDILEIPIQTVYESKSDHKTHFHPIKDSIRIYALFANTFLRYMLSALSSCVIDLLLFHSLCNILRRGGGTKYHILIATIIARVISASYNYCINYRLVFLSNEKIRISIIKYFGVAVVIMLFSALFVSMGSSVFNAASDTMIKIIVDMGLFFVSYKVQQRLVYR